MREELEIFAQNLRTYMNYYGYTNITLGKAVGNAPSTISEWRHGKKFPRVEKVQKLTELFHCEANDLLSEGASDKEIRQKAQYARLKAYFDKLNENGIEKTLQYMEDLNDKYFKGDEK